MVHGVRNRHGNVERGAGVVDCEAVGLLESGSGLCRARPPEPSWLKHES
jgi:hypothetical protein